MADMNKRRRKIVWQQYIGMAFMMLIGAICGFIMVWYIDNPFADTEECEEENDSTHSRLRRSMRSRNNTQ